MFELTTTGIDTLRTEVVCEMIDELSNLGERYCGVIRSAALDAIVQCPSNSVEGNVEAYRDDPCYYYGEVGLGVRDALVMLLDDEGVPVDGATGCLARAVANFAGVDQLGVYFAPDAADVEGYARENGWLEGDGDGDA